jgi:hypothetical protein
MNVGSIPIEVEVPILFGALSLITTRTLPVVPAMLRAPERVAAGL